MRNLSRIVGRSRQLLRGPAASCSCYSSAASVYRRHHGVGQKPNWNGNGKLMGIPFLSQSQSVRHGYCSQSKAAEMKHQEIEGPTVERDLSPLANETREVSLRLMKAMYDVSRLLAALALTHLALGAYSYCTSGASVSLGLNAVAFGLPFSTAFLLRQSLKPMHFFNKMETMGRLQILTSTMQMSKHLHLFFLRLRAVSFLCLAGLPLSLLVSLYFPHHH